MVLVNCVTTATRNSLNILTQMWYYNLYIHCVGIAVTLFMGIKLLSKRLGVDFEGHRSRTPLVVCTHILTNGKNA